MEKIVSIRQILVNFRWISDVYMKLIIGQMTLQGNLSLAKIRTSYDATAYIGESVDSPEKTSTGKAPGPGNPRKRRHRRRMTPSGPKFAPPSTLSFPSRIRLESRAGNMQNKVRARPERPFIRRIRSG